MTTTHSITDGKGRQAPCLAGPDGFRIYPGYLERAAAKAMVETVLMRIEAAPLFRGVMPKTGTPLRIPMTNLGPLGWVSDRAGYRYQPHHPETGAQWAPIPETVMAIWDAVSGYPHPPEACLVNLYQGPKAGLGLHVDADEDAHDAPVVSISLGDTALFRLGGPKRKDPTRSMRLSSGDIVVLGGAARRYFHGVDRIYPGTSSLVPGSGRINLTLRRVTRPS